MVKNLTVRATAGVKASAPNSMQALVYDILPCRKAMITAHETLSFFTQLSELIWPSGTFSQALRDRKTT